MTFCANTLLFFIQNDSLVSVQPRKWREVNESETNSSVEDGVCGFVLELHSEVGRAVTEAVIGLLPTA
jgi:hypothetical protein